MIGLFGTLDLGARSLSTQQKGVEVAGQNMANVNNPAYARQRLVIQADLSFETPLGPQGTGVHAVAIQTTRDALIDRQVQGEASVTGYWEAQQRALQNTQSSLGEQIDSQQTSRGVGTVGGMLDSLDGLAQAFSAWAASPSSTADRQAVLAKAQQLVGQFQQTDARLEQLRVSLDESVQAEVVEANGLLAEIANINKQISRIGGPGGSGANDLRDLRQQKVEQLSGMVNAETAEDAQGLLNVSISGVLVVSGLQQVESLETYPEAGGNLMVRAASTDAPLTLTGGRLAGTLEARDGLVTSTRASLNTIASTLIAEVNAVHAAGFDLNGGNGEAFFAGTNAADIAVNQVLIQDPARLQGSAVAGAAGDNRVALRLAELMDTRQAALTNRTFAGDYSRVVAAVGESLSSTNSSLTNQKAVQGMLERQRQEVIGVSLDEEMTDLMRFQKAFQASARLVSTIDEMLTEVVNLKR